MIHITSVFCLCYSRFPRICILGIICLILRVSVTYRLQLLRNKYITEIFFWQLVRYMLIHKK